MQSIKQVTGTLTKVSGKIKFPKKFKGTILEKWADYWKNLFIDYRQMLQDLRTDIQDEPLKTLKWTAILGLSIVLAKNSPDELDFKNELKEAENKAAMVGDECLNKQSIEHLRFLETCYNAGLIHYQSLGILSIMYTSDLNPSCDLFKAHCSYMKPSYLSFPSRIIDVGVMGRWWNLYKKTTNYDVNFY